MTILTRSGYQHVKIESVFETNKDGRGGCVFINRENGNKFFLRFDQFSFVANFNK